MEAGERRRAEEAGREQGAGSPGTARPEGPQGERAREASAKAPQGPVVCDQKPRSKKEICLCGHALEWRWRSCTIDAGLWNWGAAFRCQRCGQQPPSWLHCDTCNFDLCRPCFNRRKKQHQATASFKFHVLGLGGKEVELTVAPDEHVRQCRGRIALAMDISADRYQIKLMCGTELLEDDRVVSALPQRTLQVLLVKTPIFEMFGLEAKGDSKYSTCSTLAPNGRLFFAPRNAKRVLCVDTAQHSARLVGREILGSNKYIATGALAADGQLFFAPYNASQVLCIDTATEKVKAIGPEIAGHFRYTASSVIAHNGRIYFAPLSAMQVLCIDPGTGTAELIGPEMPGKNKFSAPGVLGQNGCVYFVPQVRDDGLLGLWIDPETQVVSFISLGFPLLLGFTSSSVAAANGRIFYAPHTGNRMLCIEGWTGEPWFLDIEIPPELRSPLYCAEGVLAQNGKIYFAPHNALQVLVVDPEAGTVEAIGHPMQGICKYMASGVLAPNGLIYFAPFNAEQVLCIAPDQNLVGTIGPCMQGQHKYFAKGVTAPNGKVYIAPFNAPRVLCIDPELGADGVEFFGPELEGSNKYSADGVLSPAGRMYFAPHNAPRALCIDA